MNTFGLRHAPALLLALSAAWVATPARSFSLDEAHASDSVICTPKSKGEWDGHISRGDSDIHERCDSVQRCVDKKLTSQVASCTKRGNCAPLAVHRNLARLGCTFESDEFWLPADAQLVAIQHRSGALTATLQWNSKTCRKGELAAIRRRLNKSDERKSSQGRWLAIQNLLSHGCNVDVSKLEIAGGFEKVDLTRDEHVRAGPIGIVPQPVTMVSFVPLRPLEPGQPPPPPGTASEASATSEASAPSEASATSGPSNQPGTAQCKTTQDPTSVQLPNQAMDGDIFICTALARLLDAKQFAICTPPADDHGGILMHFNANEDPKAPYARVVRIIKTATREGTPYCFSLPAGTLEDWRSLPCGGTTDIGDQTPDEPAPVLSTGAAAGSIGLGAVLAAIAKWLLSFLKKQKRERAPSSALADHEAHDVQVIITLSEPSTRTRTGY